MPRPDRRPPAPTVARPGRLARVLAVAAAAVPLTITLSPATGAAAAEGAPSARASAPYAALATPGPALSPSPAALAAALKCTGDAAKAGPTPVLFVPATGVTPEQNYDWNWKPALTRLGVPFCTIELPDHSLGDIQTAGEYVTSAIRELHRRAGRRISIIGHSQGGMVFRWSLRFWPDTRAMVDDAIGFAGSNHGTTVLDLLPTCRTTGCPVASVQQQAGSRFVQALNSGQETFAGVSYTNVRTKYDEVVTPSDVADPATASSSLTTGGGRITNVAVQDVCPGELSEHLLVGTTSNTSYALAMDALTHDGPANPARVPAATCAAPLMPGVDAANLQGNLTALSAAPGLISVLGVNLVGVPLVTEEPALKSYVFAKAGTASGGGAATATRRARLRITPGRIRAGRTTRLRLRTTTTAGAVLSRERVRVLGRTVRTDRRGRATVRVRPTRAGLVTARATGNGLPAATARIRVLRAR
jgi:triacylglycerol esterase/lipase EstA (alpha/beta hydrolase family)